MVAESVAEEDCGLCKATFQRVTAQGCIRGLCYGDSSLEVAKKLTVYLSLI